MENLHEGHRRRMAEKLLEGSLLEHELLEVLLFQALKRRNTNDLAHRLLAAFGSVEGIFSASIEELKRVRGVGDTIALHLYCVGEIYRRCLRKKEVKFQGKFTSQAFVPFVKSYYADIVCEVLDVYCIDSEGELVGYHRFTNEKKDKVELSPTDLTRILIADRPSGIVLVHNHPHGNAVASEADEELTKCAQLVCNMHDVLLCDHFIYAPNGVYSYYLSGDMKIISAKYSLTMEKGENRLVEKGK